MDSRTTPVKNKGKGGPSQGQGGRTPNNNNGRRNNNNGLSANNGIPFTQLSTQEYQQFVASAIERGRFGGAGGLGALGFNPFQLPLYPGLGLGGSNGILQAVQPQQAYHPHHSQNTQAQSLAGIFQGMGISNGGTANTSGGGGGRGHKQKKQAHTQQESHEEMTKRLNKEAVLRADPAFQEMFGTASQVALYNFDENGRDWVDTKTAGPLFLYKRAVSPEYGLVVLNRKGLKDTVIFFDCQSSVIPQKPYLLFRTGPNEAIKCIWFYNEAEFFEAINLFRKMRVQFDQSDDTSTEAAATTQASASVTVSSGSGLVIKNDATSNLFDMLKQSQTKVNDSTALNSSSKIFTAEELEQQMFTVPNSTAQVQNPSGPSKSVGGMSLLEKLTESKGNMELKKRYDSESGTSTASQTNANASSRSMKTIEQLEKNLMPEDAAKKQTSELLATLGIKPPSKDAMDSSSEVCSPNSSEFLTPTSHSDSEKSQRKLTIDDIHGKLHDETDSEIVREVVENLSDLTELLLLLETVPGYSEQKLVWRKRSNLARNPSPTRASHMHEPAQGRLSGQTNGIVRTNNTSVHQSPQNQLKNAKPAMNANALTEAQICQSPRAQPKPAKPATNALTEAQLLQAITHLLQTDPSFISKIHEAYIKSLERNFTPSRSD